MLSDGLSLGEMAQRFASSNSMQLPSQPKFRYFSDRETPRHVHRVQTYRNHPKTNKRVTTLEQLENHRQGERADTALRALRAYKDDLDHAIEAFSVYAATFKNRGSIEMPSNSRKVSSNVRLKG